MTPDLTPADLDDIIALVDSIAPDEPDFVRLDSDDVRSLVAMARRALSLTATR